jgi:photosystem II stability/assembly factor-like uncharacterized protein
MAGPASVTKGERHDAGPLPIAAGTPGVWENVTPPGVSLDQKNPGNGDNYGVLDVLAVAAQPTDLYAFICHQGVWRSQDFGTTWKQVSPGGWTEKLWGTAIDPSPKGFAESPWIYAGSSAAIGFLRSSGGVGWIAQRLPDEFGDYKYQQVYSVDIDPYDIDHVIVGFHEAPDIGESTDGGKTWRKIRTPPEDAGGSYYPYFVHTGDAATTPVTWLVIPQQNGPARALRTTDAGAHWTKLGQFQHHHGSAQIFDAGGGTLYVAAMQPSGIHKSTDYGQTWKMLSTMSDGVIAGTRRNLYASVGLGWGTASAPQDPHLVVASRRDDTHWTTMKAPAAMVDGAKRIAVTHDAEHDILVAGMWHAGIWRYIEPRE